MLPTIYSIASLPMLYRVSVPYLESVLGSTDPGIVGPALVRSFTKRIEHVVGEAADEALAPSRMLESRTRRYLEHEALVRDSLEGLVGPRTVLFDPVGRSDRPEGVSALSPKNRLAEDIAARLDPEGSYFQVGPLLVPLAVTFDGFDRHPALAELYDPDEQVAFPSRADPWTGYVRFNPALFSGESDADPFDDEARALARDSARVARALVALRARAVSDAVHARFGPSDPIRYYAFASSVLGSALEEADASGLVPWTRFAQIGGRVSSGRVADREGLSSAAALAKLEAYAGRRTPVIAREPSVEYQQNARYDWLLEPVAGRLEIVVEDGLASSEYSEEDLERFSAFAHERGWGITNAAPRLTQLFTDPVELRDLDSGVYALFGSLPVRSLAPLPGVELEASGPLVRPSDANVEPYSCAVAHHIRSGLSHDDRASMLRSGFERMREAGYLTRAAIDDWRTMRDADLRSFWPALGRIAHRVYRGPYVPYEAPLDVEAASEVAFRVPLLAASGPVALSMRADIAIDAGETLVLVERKHTFSNPAMARDHREQLLLSIAGIEAAYPGRFERAVGVVDANAPYAPRGAGIRPQRFAGFVVDPRGDAVRAAVDRAAAVAYVRDELTPELILEEKERNAASREGERGRKRSSLCSECGTIRRSGEVRGHLGTRWICDSLIEKLSA